MSLEVKITKKLDGFTLHANFAARSTATAILGASGCGKSMTLRCIAGIVKPDKGRIVLDGRVLFDSEQHIDLPPQQRGVGLLFQNYALFPNMTVEQNILCGLKAEKDKAGVSLTREKVGNLPGMPDVKGMGARDAVYILESRGLKVRLKGRGKVVQQSIPAGHSTRKGMVCELVLS